MHFIQEKVSADIFADLLVNDFGGLMSVEHITIVVIVFAIVMVIRIIKNSFIGRTVSFIISIGFAFVLSYIIMLVYDLIVNKGVTP